MLYRYIRNKVQHGQAGSVKRLTITLAVIGVVLFVLAFVGWYTYVPVKQALAAENAADLRAQLFTGVFMDRSVLPASLAGISTFGFACAMLMKELLIASSVFFALSLIVAMEKSLAVKQENGSLWETVKNTAVEYFQQPKWGLQLFSDVMKIILMLAFVFPFYWMIITAFKTYPESLNVPPTMWPTQWTMEGYENGDKSVVTDSVYNKLLYALEGCHSILGEKYDIANKGAAAPAAEAEEAA